MCHAYRKYKLQDMKACVELCAFMTSLQEVYKIKL
jgi:hypothetical protein